MTVYRLRPDANRYQSLDLVREEEWDQLLDWFGGEPIGSSWRPLMGEILREEEDAADLLPSDFPSLGGTIPVFSERAVQALDDLLRPNGEILPLRCDEGVYFAYNVTRVVDALDEERCEFARFSDGGIFNVEHHEFRSECLAGVDIFLIPQLPKSPAYVTDGFVQRVQEADLKGFLFQEVWSGPNG